MYIYILVYTNMIHSVAKLLQASHYWTIQQHDQLV